MANALKLTVLVDNFCTTSIRGLWGEWGYSALLETSAGSLLLDTGESGTVLLNNMKVLGIAPGSLSGVYLSHGHTDHANGLTKLLQVAPDLPVWAAEKAAMPRFRSLQEAKEDVRLKCGLNGVKWNVVSDATEILPDVWAFETPKDQRDPCYCTTCRLWEKDRNGNPVPDTFADDLSILVHGDAGWSLLLGCAHAGLPNILRRVEKRFGVRDFDTIVGGTHMGTLDAETQKLWIETLSHCSVRRWRLDHCTGFKAGAKLFAAIKDVDWAGVGTKLEL